MFVKPKLEQRGTSRANLFSFADERSWTTDALPELFPESLEIHKSKDILSHHKLLCKKLNFAKSTVEAQKRMNKSFDPKAEMEQFTIMVYDFDKTSCAYLASMRQKILAREREATVKDFEIYWQI